MYVFQVVVAGATLFCRLRCCATLSASLSNRHAWVWAAYKTTPPIDSLFQHRIERVWVVMHQRGMLLHGLLYSGGLLLLNGKVFPAAAAKAMWSMAVNLGGSAACTPACCEARCFGHGRAWSAGNTNTMHRS